MQTPEEFWNCLALCQYTSDRLALIAARDARLLDEAAERGVNWLRPVALIDDWPERLRAAIKGAAHE